MQRFAAKLTILALAVALLPAMAFSQVTGEATASAFSYKGNWSVGSEITQSVPLVYFGAQKGNIFSLGAREIMNPGVFQVYGALGNYQPDLSKLLAKTTLNPDQVTLSFDVVGGLATLNSGLTAPALEGRVNIQWALTPNTSFTGGYAGGGLIGQDRFGVVSAGFAHLFGGPSTQSLAKLRFIKRYAIRKHAGLD